MKKWVIVSLCLVLLLSVSISSTAASNEEQQIRVLINTNNPIVKGGLKSKYGVRHDFKEQGFTTDVTPQAFEDIKKRKGEDITVSEVGTVHTMEINRIQGKVTVKGPSDPTPWGIEKIYNNSLITNTSGGSGITIAVLDTGVYKSHTDLTRRIISCRDFTNMKKPIVEDSCSDGNGHGTHVSGTILADGGVSGTGIWGVAPSAELWAYKVLNDRGSGYSDDIARAIDEAVNQSVLNSKKLIISMSLGSSTKNSLIETAINNAVKNGVLVIAAAGNSGPSPDSISYPGALQNVVAVAALENVIENNSLRIADFSSRGSSAEATVGNYIIQERDIEVSAPGRNVESTWNDGGYNTISGTSMATPHISGLAAKIWSEKLITNQSYTAAEVRSQLQSAAKSNDILGGISASLGDDIASGFGFPHQE